MLEGQRTDPDGVGELIGKPGSCVLLGERAGELLACANIEKRGEVVATSACSRCGPTSRAKASARAMLAEAERIARSDWNCTRDADDRDLGARRSDRRGTSAAAIGAPAAIRRFRTATSASAFPSATICVSSCWSSRCEPRARTRECERSWLTGFASARRPSCCPANTRSPTTATRRSRCSTSTAISTRSRTSARTTAAS